MKNLLKKKAKKFNSKKGFTLVELIVGIMIMLIVVSASVKGISISYRSAMIGAAKNDAQSIAQRNCDIIMTSITTNVENTKYTPAKIHTFGEMFTDSNCNKFKDDFRDSLNNIDMVISFPKGGYNDEQYAPIKQVVGGEAAVTDQHDLVDIVADNSKKYQYYTIEKFSKETQIDGNTDYQSFHITTYVYYTDKGYVTCKGEVNVLPQKSS